MARSKAGDFKAAKKAARTREKNKQSRIAKKAKQAGIKLEVAFDRSGYCYHGRIKELADAARTSGLKF